MNCIKIGLPRKLILSKRKGLLESPILLIIVSENQFSGKDLFLYNCLQAQRGGVHGEDVERGGDKVGGRGGRRQGGNSIEQNWLEF